MKKIEVNDLKVIPELNAVPANQLQQFINAGELITLQVGDRLFNEDEKIDQTFIVLEGRVRICAMQAGKLREVAIIEAGGITGYLPFSTTYKTIGYGECIKTARIFQCKHAMIKEVIRDNDELLEALIHILTSYVRNSTSQQQQNEKMFSLGKLSAGLAHELNNPAAAIARGSAALIEKVDRFPVLFKEIAALNIHPSQIDCINNLLLHKVSNTSRPVLSMLAKALKEDDLTDWLLDRDIKQFDYAENLVDFDFTPFDLDYLSDCASSSNLGVVLEWINNFLLAQKMLLDIKDSSQKISELVASVKNFTHMDRTTDKQLLDVHTGIRSTLTMLVYKLKNARIKVIENFDLNLPELKALPGELNQLWANIIDNAVDAMESNQVGTLEITTFGENSSIVVIIKDDGPGIPAEIQSRIFDPFFTTKEMGKGTGLGLDLVTRIVREHNGSIKLKSTPGSTEFVICLPLLED